MYEVSITSSAERDLKRLDRRVMTKTKHSKMGKRLIAAMKEVVDHVEGRTALPMR